MQKLGGLKKQLENCQTTKKAKILRNPKNSSNICQHSKIKVDQILKCLMLQLLACNCANKGLRPEYCDNLLQIFYFQVEIQRSSVVPINVFCVDRDTKAQFYFHLLFLCWEFLSFVKSFEFTLKIHWLLTQCWRDGGD